MDEGETRTPQRAPRQTSRAQRVPHPRNGNGHGEDQVAALIRQNQELSERLERLETGGMRTIESEAEPKPEFVLSEGMSDFTRTLVERTHAVPDNYGGNREPLYNVPDRLYLKPPPKNRPNDPPTYVWLQGTAQARAYYQDKGFYLLSPEQTQEYLERERPRLLQEQRSKAALINAMRLLVKREATLSGYIDDAEWDDSLSSMTTDRLEEEWHTLVRQTPNPNRRLPKAERVREERDAEAARLMSGVETTPPRAVVDALEQATAQARRGGRSIEVTSANWNQFR
jgi:hypothetical protein